MQKAPDAFRTISEAAEILDVPQHVLRFWETRFSQIRPMKRAGGRRYYRPQDIDLLRGIRRLLYDEGYTIKGVQKILRQHGVAHVVAVGRGELAVIPAGGAAAGQAPQDAADARSAPGEKAQSAALVTPLKREQAAGMDAAALRQELAAALRELEEARSLLRKALGEELQDAAEGDNVAAARRGSAV